MSYGTTELSPGGSPAPSLTSSSSTHTTYPSSPETPPTALDPTLMNPQAESSRSARSTPSHTSVDLPKAQAASKGGCWTCRLRRKKCDEQREGDTCQTCKRLTITCLGWGPKRPDWMRDKRAVDEYKARIKEKLSRAGLIRGQPRPNHFSRGRGASTTAAASGRLSAPHRVPPELHSSLQSPSSLSLVPSTSSSSHEDLHYYDTPVLHPQQDSYSFPGMPGASNPAFDNMYGGYVPSNSHAEFGMPPMASLYPPEIPPLSAPFMSFNTSPDFTSFANEGLQEQPTPPQLVSTNQQMLNIDHVLYEFNEARKVLFKFDAYNVISNITYDIIKESPNGPVTKAICALGQLYQMRMRVSQGIEPDLRPEHSPAVYWQHEALHQLKNGKDLQPRWSESDAMAAFYLVLFSQLSGCIVDWEEPFGILCDWLVQTRLPSIEEPWLFFQEMSVSARLAVKCVLWIDIFASITTARAPRFFPLWQRLLGERGTYWDQRNMPFQRGLRMDLLIGCPDEALLAMAEVSFLAQWKAMALREGTLSFRELIRRGDVIEQRLTKNLTDVRLINDINHKLIQGEAAGEPDVMYPSDDARTIIATLFREGAILHLHTVLSNPNPGVPEIGTSVHQITQLLEQLRRSAPLSSELERTLVLPIVLGGCMTNDYKQRDFLRQRIQMQNESIGNLLQARLLMELVWQKRDVNPSHSLVTLSDTIQERGLRLLLI